MHVPKNAMLLRIFVGEDQRYHTHPLYESIVLKAASCILQAQPSFADLWVWALEQTSHHKDFEYFRRPSNCHRNCR